MNYEIKKLPKISGKPNEIDVRGYLIEFLKKSELEEQSKEFAQIYCATLAPNAVRGNHYHERRRESFAILSGKILLILEDVNTKERKEIELDSSNDHIPRVDFGVHTAHAMKNISDETVFLIAHSTVVYDSKDTDDVKYHLL